MLRLTTEDGTLIHQADLPAHTLPATEAATPLLNHQSTQDWVAEAPPGPVLALGIRAPSHDQLAAVLQPFGDRDIVGVDVHEGIGIDHIVDVHCLSQAVEPGSFAIVYSRSVLEHVALPWLVALECSRVLKVGGLALHSAPWIWPTHASPNDFWRFSPAGLEQLFSSALGFELLASGSSGPAVVMPHPAWREEYVRMPTMSSDAESWIVVRKVAESDAKASWPYDAAAGIATARRYPVDGLSVPLTPDNNTA